MKTTILILLLISTSLIGAINRSYLAVETGLRTLIKTELPGVSRVEVSKMFFKETPGADVEIVGIRTQPPVGLIYFSCQWVERGQLRTTEGSALVRVFDQVAIAKTSIRHGELFSTHNVQFEEKDITNLSVSGYFSDLAGLQNYRARGQISARSIIGLSQTESPLLINAGQFAELRHETKHLRVSARVKAMESGRLGQWIRVENPTTRKIIQGKVIDSGVLSLH